MARVLTSLAGVLIMIAPVHEGLAHASLHYGNVIVYLRVMGFTPPSS